MLQIQIYSTRTQKVWLAHEWIGRIFLSELCPTEGKPLSCEINRTWCLALLSEIEWRKEWIAMKEYFIFLGASDLFSSHCPGRATESQVHECLVTECLVTECLVTERLYIWMPNWMQEISHNMLSSSFPGQITSVSSTGAIRMKRYRQHLSNNPRPKLPKTFEDFMSTDILTNSARRLMEENSLYIRNMLMVSHSLFS